MILLALALYFLLFSLLAALLIFPPARLRLVRLAGQIGSGLSQASRTGSQRLVIGPADSIGSGARRLMGIVRRHRKLLLLTAAASLAPSLSCGRPFKEKDVMCRRHPQTLGLREPLHQHVGLHIDRVEKRYAAIMLQVAEWP